MATLKALKIRIGSVSSSEKITGAMKMISSAKVHKFELELKRLTPYQNQIKSVMTHILATDTDFNSPLIVSRDVKSIAIVVYGTDDGLCGAYNINLFKFFLSKLDELRLKYGENVDITLFPVGRKLHKPCCKLASAHLKVEIGKDINSKMEGETVNDFTHTLRGDFLSGRFDLVEVVYMHYHSMSRQRAVMKQIFPVTEEAIQGKPTEKKELSDNKLYIFEPDANMIFNEDVRALDNAGSHHREPRLRAGSQSDGNAVGQRQRKETSRPAAAGIQQAAPAEHHHRAARYHRWPGEKITTRRRRAPSFIYITILKNQQHSNEQFSRVFF